MTVKEKVQGVFLDLLGSPELRLIYMTFSRPFSCACVFENSPLIEITMILSRLVSLHGV